MEILNRKARYDYFIEDTIEAGIVLTGTEIKSIRAGNCNIKDCYGIIKNNEVFLLNMYVGQYKEGNIFNHEEDRTRKLLMHKKEILKLNNKVNLSGYTLIPLRIYLSHGLAKVEIGLCKGKHNYDKKETIKERDIERYNQKHEKY